METVTAKLELSGRILIPAKWRRKLGLQPGEDVILAMDANQITVLGTRLHALRRAQETVRSYIPADVRLSDELITERREEARQEDQD